MSDTLLIAFILQLYVSLVSILASLLLHDEFSLILVFAAVMAGHMPGLTQFQHVLLYVTIQLIQLV